MTSLIKHNFIAETKKQSLLVYIEEPARNFGFGSEHRMVMSYHYVEQEGVVLSNTLFSNIMEVCHSYNISKTLMDNNILYFFMDQVRTYFDENKHVPYFIYEEFIDEMDVMFNGFCIRD